MRGILTISFLPLVLLFIAGSPRIEYKTDTLNIRTSGINNQIRIDTLYNDHVNDSLVNGIKGEIIQEGENNSVEISTMGKATNSKSQMTKNKQQIPSSRKNLITIKQTGINNSAIINTP